VLGDKDVDPTPEQLEEMKAHVEQGMVDGCVGISTALIYPPGSYAKTEQLIELAKIVSKYGGNYQTHVRNESGQLLEAIEEALRIGREASIPVHIYHLKAAGEENWHLMPKALKLIADAREEGLKVTADIYPYIRNGIGLESFIHPRHYADGHDAFLPTLGNPEVRKNLRAEIETTSDWENWYRHVGKNWDNVLISNLGKESNPEIAGQSVKEVAAQRGQDVWDVFFDLVMEGVGVNPKSMNEEQKHQALKAPFVCIDTDAAPKNPKKIASCHPRAFGAFARIIAKYVREEKVISLEEAIYRMAALPAEILKIKNRGLVGPGYYADLLIFDPDRVQDRATFTSPLEYSEGFDYVLINGAVIIDDGRMTDALPGHVIRHKQ
jgi:N-acyl-D-aspartate/D-glutamate deacylase